MARIEGIPRHKAGLFARLAYWFSKRMVGKVVEPMTISAHHPWIFRAYGAYEFMLDRARLVDARLKTLADLKAAALIGCPF
ncbi:MAG: hypothetical protein ACRERD_21610 [Candidatus Binatia bacterium]